MRLDAAIARLSMLANQKIGLTNQNGGPMQMKDFMPYGHDEEPEATLHDVAAILTAKKVI